MKQQTYKVPKGHFFRLVKAFLAPYYNSHFKLKINVADELPQQYVLMHNHPSAFDMYHSSMATWPKTVQYISNRYYMFNKTVGKMMRGIGCVPKSLFTTDMESIKHMLWLAKNGYSIGVMPEVRLSMYGEFEGLPESTSKMFKKMDLPVYVCHLDGSYFTKPKWAKNVRKGVIEITIKKMFSQEELRNATVEQVHQAMLDNLYYNDFDWLERHPELHYKSKKLAEKLENILYVCPHCHKKFYIASKGNKVYCAHCGYYQTLNDRYSFAKDGDNPPYFDYFDNFQQWFKWQKQQVADEVATNDDYKLQTQVKLSIPDPSGRKFTKRVGEGTVTLDMQGLRFVGTKDKKPFELNIPMHKAFYLSYMTGKGFQTFCGMNEYYLFEPNNPYESIVWYIASEQLTLKFASQCN